MKHYFANSIKGVETNVIVLLVLLISLLGFVSIDIFFPSLPAITKYFNITQGQSQLTIALYLSGFGFSQLIYGPCSDYFGRRPVLLVGFFIYLSGTLILVNSTTAIYLLLARFIQGVGTGASASLCRVILRDKFVGDAMAKAASYVTIGIGFATAVAPALGGLIQEYIGFEGNFKAMLAFGLFVLVLIFLFLPETHAQLRKPGSHPSNCLAMYKSLFSQYNFICYTLCSGLSLAALLSYAIINPFLIEKSLGLSASFYGIITLIIASGEIVGTYCNSRLLDHYGCNRMLGMGISLLFLSGLIFVIESLLGIFNIFSIGLPSFIITFSVGIIIPNATASAFSSIKDSIGTAGALYGFCQIAMAAIFTYVITMLNTQTQSKLGVLIIIVAILSILVVPKLFNEVEK